MFGTSTASKFYINREVGVYARGYAVTISYCRLCSKRGGDPRSGLRGQDAKNVPRRVTRGLRRPRNSRGLVVPIQGPDKEIDNFPWRVMLFQALGHKIGHFCLGGLRQGVTRHFFDTHFFPFVMRHRCFFVAGVVSNLVGQVI